MNTRLCLKIARRMDALLMRELGQGLDAGRMLADPVYARDVLLVSDTFRDHELSTLAARFRASAIPGPEPATPDHGADAAADSGGFSASRFLNSIFGGPFTLDPPQQGHPQPAVRGWFGRPGGRAGDRPK